MSKHFFRKDFRAVIKQSRRRGRECVIMILIHFFPPFKAKEKTYKESRFPYVANSIQRFVENNPIIKKNCALPNLTG
jgi:hypothetical protein